VNRSSRRSEPREPALALADGVRGRGDAIEWTARGADLMEAIAVEDDEIAGAVSDYFARRGFGPFARVLVFVELVPDAEAAAVRRGLEHEHGGERFGADVDLIVAQALHVEMNVAAVVAHPLSGREDVDAWAAVAGAALD